MWEGEPSDGDKSSVAAMVKRSGPCFRYVAVSLSATREACRPQLRTTAPWRMGFLFVVFVVSKTG